ncbi:MAG: ABC transporter permease [Bacilli bacterium]
MEWLDIFIRSMFVNGLSSLIAMILGSLLGLKLYFSQGLKKPILLNITRTLMSLPPVVLGLILFLLFKRNGILGNFELLYTPFILIIAQVCLLTPIVIAYTYELLVSKGMKLIFTLKMYQVSYFKMYQVIIKEYLDEFSFISVITFSRALSEVGAVMIVGGNIKNYTRLMTTAIAANKSAGNYSESIILGSILMLFAFIIQYLMKYFKGEKIDDNF